MHRRSTPQQWVSDEVLTSAGCSDHPARDAGDVKVNGGGGGGGES